MDKPVASTVDPGHADTDTGWQTVNRRKQKPRHRIVIGEFKKPCSFQ